MAELEDHVAENYRNLVNDPNRPETYASIAEYANTHASPTLAAWARAEAEAAGEDITPLLVNGAGPLTARDLNDLKVPELRDLLAEQGVDPSGLKKPELIAALEEHIPEAIVEEGEYSTLTDDELRELAASDDLDTEGTRDELIARLTEAAAKE